MLSPHPTRFRDRHLGALLAALLGSSCTGEISDSVPDRHLAAGGNAAAGTTPGATTSGGNGGGLGSGNGASGGSSTSGGATNPGTGSPAAGGGSAQCTSQGVPFRVLTRLNRAEYDNTARDLLGDGAHTALSVLPADSGDGAFDNNAAALSIDPSLAGNYLELAEKLAENALATNSPGRKLLVTCTATDNACARQIADGFATRAWRRPLASGEGDKLYAIYTATRSAGFTFDQGIQMVAEAALMSPNFLFRPEIDAMIDSTATHAVAPYELATRLSYFLWSSMPDATLETSAGSGELATTTGLAKQVQRMWTDPRAEAFHSRFPGLWLRTLDVGIAKQPASDVFPSYSPAIEAAMETETARYMREFVTADVDFLDFINAKFTYLNQTLAQFYGIPGQFGNDFTRVDLSSNSQRGGILTQGAFLTVTSPPERTSPVMRGQWVLARIVMSAPPPPPPDVPPIEATPVAPGTSMRQRMAVHAANPACVGCHNLMDPIGFGLENYDGIGRFRTSDNGAPVDSSGTLFGQAFNGALELESILRNDPRVPRSVVTYLASYALGRELGSDDQCAIDTLSAGFAQDRYRMTSLVARVAGSELMRSRRGAP